MRKHKRTLQPDGSTEPWCPGGIPVLDQAMEHDRGTNSNKRGYACNVLSGRGLRPQRTDEDTKHHMRGNKRIIGPRKRLPHIRAFGAPVNSASCVHGKMAF